MGFSDTSRVILVVEDDWIVRDAIAHALRDAGWNVLETDTAENAITLIQAGHRIDLVFTDIQLAGHLSGWDVAEQFRAVQADMPIIYTSGNSVERSRRVAGSLFFEKPYLPAEVVDACRRLA